jgi:hypothetical protein
MRRWLRIRIESRLMAALTAAIDLTKGKLKR